MRRVEEALQQLDAISAIADRAATFEGLRWGSTAVTAGIAVTAATVQTRLVPRSSDPLFTYLTIWVGVAVIALAVVLADMVLRYYRDPTARARRMTLEVLGRLAPSIVVGAAITIIVFFSAREVAWMLPGLWSVLLGLGIFAASSILPRPLQQVGIWYIGCGLAVLLMSRGDAALSPLAMAVPFGGGQGLAAWLMLRTTSPSESQV